MSLFSERDQIKNTIKDAADIVQVIGECVELKRAGSRFTGRCPFHNEKTPSFFVNPQGQFYHCFGCGEHGDVFSFVMKFYHLEFPDALKMLAQKFGITLPERQLTASEQAHLHQRKLLYQANEEAVAVYQTCLRHPKWGKIARAYLEKRGVPQEYIDRYRLGFAPETDQAGWQYLFDQLTAKGLTAEVLEKVGLAVRKDQGGHYDRFRGRVMFPILDMTGQVAAFGGRILGDGQPKYMNSPESPIFEKSQLLFGLQQHRQAIRQARRALVVEGNFDLLSLVVHGVENVVAPLGTALTRKHVHSLRSYCDEIVLFFDADSAGLKAARRSIPYLLAEQVEGRVALLPEGHDPDSFVREQGAAGVNELVKSARPLPEFVFDALVREYGLTLAGKTRIVGELRQMLAEATDRDQRELMVSHFCAKLGVSPGYFQRQADNVTSRKQIPAVQQDVSSQNMPRRDRQLVDFLLFSPQSLGVLQEAGLEKVLTHPLARSIVAHVGRHVQKGPCQPEDLLTDVADAKVEQYIVARLTETSMIAEAPELREESVSRPVDELCSWLHFECQRRDEAAIQQRIVEAERQGDMELVQQLLREKQALATEKTKNSI